MAVKGWKTEERVWVGLIVKGAEILGHWGGVIVYH